MIKKRIILFIIMLVITLTSCIENNIEDTGRTKPPPPSLPRVTATTDDSSQAVITIHISPMVYSKASLNDEYFVRWESYIKDKFGIEFNLTELQKSSYYDANRGIGEKIKSGQLTGLVYITSKGYNIIYDLIKSESIIPLDDILSANTTWSHLPDNMKSISEINGSVWGIPDQLNPYYYIRTYKKAWLSEINLDTPYDANSYYTMLQYFTENDPDNDGIKNTKGTHLEIGNLVDLFGEFKFYVQPNNGYYNFSSIAFNPEKGIFEDSMFSENTVEVFNYLRLINSNGYADIRNNESTTYGTSAFYYRNDAGTYDGLMDTYKSFVYDDSLDYSMGFSENTSSQRFYNFEGGIYVLCSNSENEEKTINSFLDLFFGEQAGFYAAKIGIEQTAFNLRNNNLLIETMEISMNGMPLFVGSVEGLFQEDKIIYGNNETRHNELAFSKEFCENLYKKNSHKVYDLYPKTGYLVYEKGASYIINGNSMTISSPESNSEKLLKLFNAMYGNMLNGDVDIDATINEYKKEANKLGLPIYLEEINSKLKQ